MPDRDNTSLRADLDTAAEFIKNLDQMFWYACLRAACLKGSKSGINGFLLSSHTISSPRLYLRPHFTWKAIALMTLKSCVFASQFSVELSKTCCFFKKNHLRKTVEWSHKWQNKKKGPVLIKHLFESSWNSWFRKDIDEAGPRIIGVFVVLWHYLEQFYQQSWTPNCNTESFQEQLFVLRP